MRFVYCPSCGSQLVTVAGGADRGHPFCPTCEVAHYDNPGVTAFVFVERDASLLLLERNQEPHRGEWDVPGGFVESGETPVEAAIRELREETGLQAGVLELLGTYKSTYGAERWTVDVAFACSCSPGSVSLSEENGAYRWVAIDDVPRLPFEGLRDGLRELQRRRGDGLSRAEHRRARTTA